MILLRSNNTRIKLSSRDLSDHTHWFNYHNVAFLYVSREQTVTSQLFSLSPRAFSQCG